MSVRKSSGQIDFATKYNFNNYFICSEYMVFSDF